MENKTLQTKRLDLRPFVEQDLESFARMNGDPRVMEFFLSPLSREESDALVERIQAHFEKYGWGLWAVSVRGGPDFIGFIGLHHVDRKKLPAHFTPAVEVGWRLAPEFWGKGYATEGAKKCLEFGFETLNLEEIVSFTPVLNTRSMGVMERIGMHHDPADDFDHPMVPEGHPLRRHVLYRIKNFSKN